MDEAFWLSCTDPVALLNALHPMHSHGSDLPQSRASRMYLLACARRQWHILPQVCRKLVYLVEVYAESPDDYQALQLALEPIAERLMNSAGEADDLLEAEKALAALNERDDISPIALLGQLSAADQARLTTPPPPANSVFTPDAWRGLAAVIYLPLQYYTPTYSWLARKYHSLSRLREVFGNPYQPLTIDPTWNTPTVQILARQMYDARNFEAMPVLADALQEAGCPHERLLAHCRDPRITHVRGCWVLDALLDLR
jgi:hypothetical protein